MTVLAVALAAAVFTAALLAALLYRARRDNTFLRLAAGLAEQARHGEQAAHSVTKSRLTGAQMELLRKAGEVHRLAVKAEALEEQVAGAVAANKELFAELYGGEVADPWLALNADPRDVPHWERLDEQGQP